MFISQSAISQQIKLLEDQLGVQLLDRKNRAFTLTPAGQFFYRESKILLSNTNDMINKTKEIANAKQHLCIGNIDDSILFDTIIELTKKIPSLTVSLSKGTHDDLYEELVGERIDIALNDQSREFNQEYENNVLNELPLYALVSEDSPIADKEKVNMSGSIDMKCVLVTPTDRNYCEKDYYNNYLGVKGGFTIAGDRDQALKMLKIENSF